MGSLVVVSGPSGAGKTTVVAGALRRRPEVVLSVSATTRQPRGGEEAGHNYLFLTPEEFADRERRGGFLEVADVHGNRYGTPRAAVEDALAEGKTVVLEIDVQGAASIRRVIPEAITVFILPPSEDLLRERLRARGTDAQAVIDQRIQAAEAELAEAGAFDHRIVNEDLEEAISQLVRILDGSNLPSSGPDASRRGGRQGENG